MPPSKQHLKQLTEQVQRVLLQDWDPIGVNDEPLAQDEYVSYASKIAGMLWHGADKARIADHLYQIETHAMGLSGSQARCESVALKLLSLVAQRA